MIKKFLVMFFFISACGYQPIYLNKNEIVFKDIVFVGDKKINRKIISLSSINKDPKNKVENTLVLESKKRVIETSKNSKGQVASYRTEIEINLTIKINDEIIKQKNFIQVFNYNNIKNKFDLSSYQNDVENNLVSKIVEDLIVYINL
tara:strand:- start:2182 stop:2622 length:441 start_codon:yes stop_codon:yes gene_type:complete